MFLILKKSILEHGNVDVSAVPEEMKAALPAVLNLLHNGTTKACKKDVEWLAAELGLVGVGQTCGEHESKVDRKKPWEPIELNTSTWLSFVLVI